MARSQARVVARRPGELTRLGAFWIQIIQTWAVMAGPLAEVTAAREDFAAEVAAPNFPQVAGYVLAKLLAAQTHSFRQLNARGALGLVVAGVANQVIARMFPRAGPLAGGPFSPAGYGRVGHRGSAPARQLLKTCEPASVAISRMATFCTLVQATGEFTFAFLLTHVICIGTTIGVAPVFSARQLLVASTIALDLLALIHLGQQLLARHFHSGRLARTEDFGSFIAIQTQSIVALLLAVVFVVFRPAGELLAANLPAPRQRVEARGSRPQNFRRAFIFRLFDVVLLLFLLRLFIT